jgi:polyisoprenoid-binding protein YceI
MAQLFKLDPTHSRVGFSVRHLGISNIRGHFADFSGDLQVDKSDPTGAKVEVTIKTSSIDTANAARDGHLSSPEFFDAASYPEIRFVSTRIEARKQDLYTITGNLTMHGQTREIELEAEIRGPIDDPFGNERVGIVATGRLKRSDWGISWNQLLEAGGFIVSDEVELEIEVEATAQPA